MTAVSSSSSSSIPQHENHIAARKLFESVTTNRPPSWTADVPLSQWKGIGLDNRGNIVQIVLSCTKMEGQLNWDVLPELRHLTELNLCDHKLSGSFSTSDELRALPLRTLTLYRSNDSGLRLTGMFDLNHLPPTIVELNLSNNSFTIRNWSSMARLVNLRTLDFAGSDLSLAGNVDFALLPRSLVFFAVWSCTFAAGTAVDLAALPASLTRLWIDFARNLTLHCSDIGKFAQLRLENCSKNLLAAAEVLLGNIGDATARRVTGKKLCEMAASILSAPIEQQQQQQQQEQQQASSFSVERLSQLEHQLRIQAMQQTEQHEKFEQQLKTQAHQHKSEQCRLEQQLRMQAERHKEQQEKFEQQLRLRGEELAQQKSETLRLEQQLKTQAHQHKSEQCRLEQQLRMQSERHKEQQKKFEEQLRVHEEQATSRQQELEQQLRLRDVRLAQQAADQVQMQHLVELQQRQLEAQQRQLDKHLQTLISMMTATSTPPTQPPSYALQQQHQQQRNAEEEERERARNQRKADDAEWYASLWQH